MHPLHQSPLTDIRPACEALHRYLETEEPLTAGKIFAETTRLALSLIPKETESLAHPWIIMNKIRKYILMVNTIGELTILMLASMTDRHQPIIEKAALAKNPFKELAIQSAHACHAAIEVFFQQTSGKLGLLCKALEEAMPRPKMDDADEEMRKAMQTIGAGTNTAFYVMSNLAQVLPNVTKRDLPNEQTDGEKLASAFSSLYPVIMKIVTLLLNQLASKNGLQTKLDDPNFTSNFLHATLKSGKIKISCDEEMMFQISEDPKDSPRIGCPAHVNLFGESTIKILFEAYTLMIRDLFLALEKTCISEPADQSRPTGV